MVLNVIMDCRVKPGNDGGEVGVSRKAFVAACDESAPTLNLRIN